jgi:hypothetical protein
MLTDTVRHLGGSLKTRRLLHVDYLEFAFRMQVGTKVTDQRDHATCLSVKRVGIKRFENVDGRIRHASVDSPR